MKKELTVLWDHFRSLIISCSHKILDSCPRDVLTWPRIIILIIWSLVVLMTITHSARISPYLVYNVIVCPLSRVTHRDPGDVTICLQRITRCLHSLSPGHGQPFYTQMRSGMFSHCRVYAEYQSVIRWLCCYENHDISKLISLGLWILESWIITFIRDRHRLHPDIMRSVT